MRRIYQIYIEYIFLLNFVFFLCIWELASIVFSCSVTQGKMIGAAFLGAVISSCCLELPFVLGVNLLIGTVASLGSSFFLMIPKGSKKTTYIKCLLIATETGVFLGGSIALVQKFIIRKSFTIGQMIVITGIITFVLRILLQRYFLTRKQLIYPVILICDEKKYHMNAFLDTGNGLIEPISQKGVCLVGKDYFERQWEKEGERKEFQPQKFRAVPYHAVGTENGILCGYEMDRLIIFTDERKVEIQKPVIGICEHTVGKKDSYQMILQPKLLGEGVK